MALNAARLASNMKALILAYVGPFYDDIPDDHRLTGYTYPEYLDRFTQAVSEAVYNEITGNAKAIGADSRGDDHDLSII